MRRAALQRAQDRILKRARDQERAKKKPLTPCQAGLHTRLDIDLFGMGLRCLSCGQIIYGI